MGTRDKNRIFRPAPNRVYVNPTNNNDPGNDYGGTLLGIVDTIEFFDGRESVDFDAEEYGTAIARQHFQRTAILSMLIRQWDADSVGTFYPTTTSGIEPVAGGASENQGQYITPVKVLVVPPVAEIALAPSLLLVSADPLSDANKRARLSVKSDFTLPVFFATRPPSGGGHPYQIGLLSLLSV